MLVAESGAVVATAATAATLLRFRRPCDQEAQRDVGRAKSAGGVPHQHASRERVRAGAKRTAREGGESREDAHRDGDAGGASLIHVAVLSATGARPVLLVWFAAFASGAMCRRLVIPTRVLQEY